MPVAALTLKEDFSWSIEVAIWLTAIVTTAVVLWPW
ncbi:hypothetical protein HNO88_004308 [Novosphingobium chloroacetimidivorans]|uniref:Uncharacterized protein n=1 Tax=Novosphingobium chloroacetimidivorans TaxID=1428314 RepID=A0A7W7NZ82_9SPHN|nr:hypothetical protein [Novosphingobium chloroacetimidivorans]